MSATTAEQLRDSVQGTAADLERLVAAVSSGQGDPADLGALFSAYGYDLDGDELEDEDSVRDTAQQILDEWALEVIEHGTRAPGGQWESSHVVVVFGTGGPHIELDTAEEAVLGYWSSDRARTGVSRTVVEYYEEMLGS